MELANRSERRPGLTGRAVAVGCLIVFLAVILAGPAHRYLAARAALNAASVQHADDEKKLAELARQVKDLQDPAFLERLARQRLQYAKPGDTVYVVTRQGQQSLLALTSSKDADAVKEPGQTWNQRLWGTIRAADGTP